MTTVKFPLWSSYVSGRLLAKCNSGRACVDKYLADAEEPDLDIKVLDWWKAKESQWPNLAKMVKQ